MEKKYKYNNEIGYWNLKMLQDCCSKIFEQAVVLDLDIQNLKNSIEKPILLHLKEKITQHAQQQNFKNKKYQYQKLLKEVEALELQIVITVEQKMHYFWQEFRINDEIVIDKIKKKIEAAIQKYISKKDAKWTSFARRIKTDIIREIKKVQQNQFVSFEEGMEKDNQNFWELDPLSILLLKEA